MAASTINEHIGPVHNSHLTGFRRCKKKYSYSYIEQIQPKLPGLPLARGIWIHYCLEAQFLKWGLEDGSLLEVPELINVDGIGNVEVRPQHMDLVVYKDNAQVGEYSLSAKGMLDLLTEHAWSQLFDAEKEKYTEDGHTLPEAVKRILEEYFYCYRDKFKDRTFEVLLVEAMWQRSYQGVEFEGRLDYIIRMKDSGLIVCGDWKSTKDQPHPEYKFMESQLNLYPWGVAPKLVELGVDSSEVNNMAVEFDYLSTKLPTIPKQNQDGTLSKTKINTTYLTLTRALKEYDKKWSEEQIQEYLANNTREFFETKRLPRNKRVVKELLEENVSDAKTMALVHEGYLKPSRTQHLRCSWDCDFLPLCKGELYGQDVRHLRKTEYEPRTNSHTEGVTKDE